MEASLEYFPKPITTDLINFIVPDVFTQKQREVYMNFFRPMDYPILSIYKKLDINICNYLV